MADQTRFLILGGGVTGLAFADWVQGDDYIVCEALDEVGGYCRTIKQDGFVWDFSGHFFHFKHPEIEQYLLERMGDQKVRKVIKKSSIWYKGGFVDFPFQKNIHQLPVEEFIDCLVDLFERDDKNPENFQEMLYAKFGKGIAEKFLIPYNEKLYATDLSNLDVDAMGRFFPYADVPDIIRNFRKADNTSYNSTFTYPEGGAIQYVNALCAGIKDANISLNERVLEIDLERKVARTEHREISYEAIISSAPLPQVLGMAKVPYDRSIYSYNKVLVFNLGFDKKGWTDPHWVYFPSRELCFYRAGFYDNIFDTDRMSLYVEIGYPSDAALDAAEIDRMRAKVLEDLERAGVVDGHKLVSHHNIVLDPAYVHITQDSLVDVEAKRTLLASHDVHSLGRYGSWTYCAIEDNIVESRALAEKIG
jgi:protoporphyrinogen oxidase